MDVALLNNEVVEDYWGRGMEGIVFNGYWARKSRLAAQNIYAPALDISSKDNPFGQRICNHLLL